MPVRSASSTSVRSIPLEKISLPPSITIVPFSATKISSSFHGANVRRSDAYCRPEAGAKRMPRSFSRA